MRRASDLRHQPGQWGRSTPGHPGPSRLLVL